MANSFAIPASRSARSPALLRSAACSVSSRAASIFVAICASFSWIAWCCAIGLPNASRCWAYRIASSNARVAMPTARAAMFTRPSSMPPMNW